MGISIIFFKGIYLDDFFVVFFLKYRFSTLYICTETFICIILMVGSFFFVSLTCFWYYLWLFSLLCVFAAVFDNQVSMLGYWCAPISCLGYAWCLQTDRLTMETMRANFKKNRIFGDLLWGYRLYFLKVYIWMIFLLFFFLKYRFSTLYVYTETFICIILIVGSFFSYL